MTKERLINYMCEVKQQLKANERIYRAYYERYPELSDEDKARLIRLAELSKMLMIAKKDLSDELFSKYGIVVI